MSSGSPALALTSAQLLAQRAAAAHLGTENGATPSAGCSSGGDLLGAERPPSPAIGGTPAGASAQALALLAAQSAEMARLPAPAASFCSRTPRQVTLTDETDDTEADDDEDEDDQRSAASDLSSRTPASHSSSLRSSLSGTNLSGGALSGTKRPSSDSLSVTGCMRALLRTDSADGLGLGGLSRNATTNTANAAATNANTPSSADAAANAAAYANSIPVLSSHTGLSLSRSHLSGSNLSRSNLSRSHLSSSSNRSSSSHRSLAKRSRSSLRSFNSGLNTVGEHDEHRANSEWTGVPLNDARPPGRPAPGSNGMPQASSAMGLRRQPSSRSVLAGSTSRSGLQNQSHHLSFADHHPHHGSAAGLHRSTTSRTTKGGMPPASASMADLTAGAAAPRPANPFLGGGQTSAAANFLSLLNGGGGGGGAGREPAAMATRMPLPPSASSTAQQGMPSPGSGGREPPSLSAAAMPRPMPSGMSSAAQEFLSLLQRTSGIGSVQALIQSQQMQRSQQSQRKAGEPEQQQQGVRKVQSFVGGSQGSTPPKAAGAGRSKTGIVAPLQVADNGAVLHHGQTAAAADAAQTDSTNTSTEAELSPQQLLMTTIRERTPEGAAAPPAIRPVLSIEHKFHEHTPAEIAAYPPTAMLVRNNDLAGLQMAHRGSAGSTTLQTSNKFGESLLHIACRRGYDDIARYLLDEAGVTPWVRDDFGRTPCHDACWTATPNLALMDLLVRRCPEMLLMSDKRGSTPLDYVRKDNWDVWRQFLSERWDVICPRAGSSTCSPDKS